MSRIRRAVAADLDQLFALTQDFATSFRLETEAFAAAFYGALGYAESASYFRKLL